MSAIASTASTRTVQWGHWGITFLLDGEPVDAIDFPVGPRGPVDGCIGTPEREAWKAICAAWKERGELPERVGL